MKNKICLICHTVIDDSNEFCEFKHHKNKDELKSRAFYHVNCFRNRINGTEIQKALAQKTMEVLNNVNARVI